MCNLAAVRATLCAQLELSEELVPLTQLRMFFTRHEKHARLALDHPEAFVLRDAVSRASIEVYRKLLADAHLEDTAYKQCHLSHEMHRQAASQEKKVVFPLASADACYVSAYSMMKCKELFGLQSFASSMLTSAQRSFANRYPSTDFNFWVQYGSWSCCSHCGSFFFNDEYFRNKVYRDAATS